MKYKSVLSYLFYKLPMYQRLGHAAYKTGLGNTIRLDKHFNHPHKAFLTIHVAGTNGKGSVSHMLASVLQEAGYKTGLYTSPHLLDFRERIRINGKPVRKKFVTDFVSENKDFFNTLNPSFFEISVLMAFEYFRINSVDIAVIEVGLGGRLDSTNIITPLLSVITNIGKDHTEFLGNSLREIAGEKAGIIKPGIPVVIGETNPETKPVFTETAQRLNSKIIFADDQVQITGSYPDIRGRQIMQMKEESRRLFGRDFPGDLICGLKGHYQRKNLATVLASLKVLKDSGIKLKDPDIIRGIAKVVENTSLMGRWQAVQKEPSVICDTAHNPDGIKEVISQATQTSQGRIHMVMGFVSDKDVRAIFKLMPHDACFYFCRLSVPRTMEKEVLLKAASEAGIAGNYFTSAVEAYEAALDNVKPGEIILVTGSTFCVADFLEYYQNKN